MRPVVVFTPELHARGGTERATLECIRRWAATWDVTVYACRVDADLPDNVTVRIVRRAPGPQIVKWAAFFMTSTWRAAVLRRRRPRPIVFSPGVNLWRADVTVCHISFRKYRAAKKATPWPWGNRGWPERTSLKGRLRRIHQAVYHWLVAAVEGGYYRRTGVVFAVSPAEAAALEAFGVAGVRLAPNGVDVDELQPSPHHRRSGDPVHIVAVGTDVWKKGLDLLIPQFGRRGDGAIRFPGVTLTIFTTPREAALLARQLTQHRTDDRVTIVSEPRSPADLYGGFDALIAPSRDDSFNMPALEAAACGLAVAVSDVCGVAHYLGDGAVVFWPGGYGPRDAMEALADVDRRRALVAKAMPRARAMTWDVPADAVAAAFAEFSIGTEPTR